MKKRALILTAVLTAAALTGGSGYLPVTDGIRSKMIQNVYADAVSYTHLTLPTN